MSLVVDNRHAVNLSRRGVAAYVDGGRPRAPDGERTAPPAPPVASKPDDGIAKALTVLADALNAQAGNQQTQQASLTALLQSNEVLGGIMAAALHPPKPQPKPVDEKWSFEHVYERGDIKKTIATRLK